MKQRFLVLLVACSVGVFSCQKETLSAGEEMAASMKSNKGSHENAVPFTGDYVTTAQFLQGPAVQIITGIGQASHLGQSTFIANATVNFSTPPPFAIAGTAVFTAANGDQFYTRFTGTNTPTGNGTSRGIINHTIVGGTGRFETATGSLTGIAVVNAANPTNTVSYTGTLDY